MSRPKGSKNKPKILPVTVNLDTTVKAPESLYKVFLTVNGQELKSEGKTLLEAIQGLKLGNWKTKGNLEIQHDNKILKRLLTITQMKRLFSDTPGFGTKIAQESIVKFFNLMLK